MAQTVPGWPTNLPGGPKCWPNTRENLVGCEGGTLYVAASAIFAGSGIQLTGLGRQYSGSAIGSAEFSEAFVKMKVEGWVYEIEQLSLIAKTHPHAAYAAYTHGLDRKWKFLLRAIPNIGDLLTPLETAIRHSLIPSITGKSDLNDHMRNEKDHAPTHPPRWSRPGVSSFL